MTRHSKLMNDNLTELRDSQIFGAGWLWPTADSICWDFFNKPLTVSQTANNPATFPYDIVPYVPNKKVVLQAGGNSGLYAKIYSTFFEKVYTFEPDNIWFRCLTHNASESNIYKFQCCLGDEHTGVSVETPSWGRTNFGAMRVSGPGPIPQLTIDSLNICPDLIHLDIEGFELFALKGARNTIETFKPVIVLEVNDLLCQPYGYRATDIDEFLSDFGYTRKKVWVEDPPYCTQDIMFVVE